MLIIGDNSPNDLKGTTANDTIRSFDGNDTIEGDLGADSIDGGSGNDAIYGDTVVLSSDGVYDGTGNDSIKGGDDQDKIFGGVGNDQLEGGSGDDELFGEQGNDNLLGDSDNDTLIGGMAGGIDELDTLTGGDGADSFVLGNNTTNFYLTDSDSTDSQFNVGGLKSFATINDFDANEGDQIVVFDPTAIVLEYGSSSTNVYSRTDTGFNLIAVINGTDVNAGDFTASVIGDG